MAPKLLSRSKRSTLNVAKQTRQYAGPQTVMSIFFFFFAKVRDHNTHEYEWHDKDNPDMRLISLRKQLPGYMSDIQRLL